jgi:acid phosphatase type 7
LTSRTLRLFVVVAALISCGGGGALLSPAPLAATGDPVIVTAGDIACDPTNSHFNGGNGSSGSCRQRYTADLINSINPAAVLPLGDNQYYCGGLSAFQQSYNLSWGGFLPITHPSVGNHEYLTSGGTDCNAGNAGANGYFTYFGAAAGQRGQGYYSYDIGTWHLIALNSNCGNAGGCSATSPQGRWLADDLTTHRNLCTLAYWHIPLYSSGGRASGNSRPFWQLLYDNNADLILSAHDHTYERFAPQTPAGAVDDVRGIREFIVGTGGANHTSFVNTAANSEVRNANTFGVLKLTLHPTSYDWQFVPEAGQTFADSGTIACHGASSGNTPPTASPVSVSATTAVQASWTPNVSDPDGDTLSCSIVTPPSNGEATVSSDCSRGTYISNAGFTGSDPFTYKVNDGHVDSPPATVTVTVSGGGGGGSIGLVQQKVASGNTGTLPATLTSSSTPGNALVAVVALAAGSSASVVSVTDSAGATWTRGPVGFLTGVNSRVEIWYRLDATSVTSVTATLSAAKSAAVNVTEWSGVASSSAVDGSLAGNGASATTVTTPSLATTNATDLVIGAINYPVTATSTLSSGPFISLSDLNASTSVHGRAAYALTSAAGSFQASWTLSTASGGNGGAIIALKAA